MADGIKLLDLGFGTKAQPAGNFQAKASCQHLNCISTMVLVTELDGGFRKARCVKCAGHHATSNCQRKDRSENVKCVLCGCNHPVNYRDCSVYKDLQKVKYCHVRSRYGRNFSLLIPTYVNQRAL
ncbi:hypothetical protein P5V15_001480 [Pogonomyrmex californicus]